LEQLRDARPLPKLTAADLLRPAVVVEISLENNSLTVGCQELGGKHSSASGLKNHLVTALRRSKGAIESRHLLEFLRMAYPKGLDHQAGSVLSEVPRQHDLSIAYSNRAITAFPWEAGLSPGARYVYRSPERETGFNETVRWIQLALRSLVPELRDTVDGLLGPNTRDGIRRLYPKAEPVEIVPMLFEGLKVRGPTPWIVVYQTALETDRYVKGAYGGVGLNVAAEYRGLCSFKIEDWSVQFQYLGEALRHSPAQLIHIVTGFLRDRTGELMLDLETLERSDDLRVKLTASYLSSVLSARQAREEAKPFVIIEARLPDDGYDRARQVLFRNAFCAELLRGGCVRGVLATGLFRTDFLASNHADFVRLIVADLPMGDLHSAVWQQCPAPFPPALFAHDPALPVLR
jgi:hypothetical protein